MTSNQPAQAQSENLAAVAGSQALATLKAAAPALLAAGGVAALASNPSAAGTVLTAAALAETQLPSIMSIANSMNALVQIGTMTPQQCLAYIHQLSMSIQEHQAALDALDPAYAASIPEATLPAASSVPATAPVQNAPTQAAVSASPVAAKAA